MVRVVYGLFGKSILIEYRLIRNSIFVWTFTFGIGIGYLLPSMTYPKSIFVTVLPHNVCILCTHDNTFTLNRIYLLLMAGSYACRG